MLAILHSFRRLVGILFGATVVSSTLGNNKLFGSSRTEAPFGSENWKLSASGSVPAGTFRMLNWRCQAEVIGVFPSGVWVCVLDRSRLLEAVVGMSHKCVVSFFRQKRYQIRGEALAWPIIWTDATDACGLVASIVNAQ